MEIQSCLFILSVLFSSVHVMSLKDYDEDEIDRCCENNMNNRNDQLGCKDRLKEKCDDLEGEYYNRCASNAIDTFVDNGKFGAAQGNDLMHCITGHNLNEYKIDRNINAYSGVLQAVGVTSITDLELNFIVDDKIREETVEELEKCEEDCEDREDFIKCCRDWIFEIKEEVKYSEQLQILGVCKGSTICKRRRNLRG